jgi:hypothetical protein
MKLSIYFDVYPWTKPEDIWPMARNTASTMTLSPGGKRYKVEVEVPDPIEAESVEPVSVQDVTPEPEPSKEEPS